jgi:hypothetical protein
MHLCMHIISMQLTSILFNAIEKITSSTSIYSSVGKGVIEIEGRERTPGSSYEYNIRLVSEASDKQAVREKQEREEYSNQFIEYD